MAKVNVIELSFLFALQLQAVMRSLCHTLVNMAKTGHIGSGKWVG